MEGPVHKTKILIVEDDSIISMHIQSNLDKLGYDVCGCVKSGSEAIRLAAECRPDLILMDIILQGPMDGIAAAKTIKDTLDIPILYLSGITDISTIARAHETNPYGYVSKPVNILHLLSMIDTVLYRRELEMSLRESAEKYRNLVEEINDVIFALDETGVITFVSSSAEHQSGYTEHDLLGRMFLDVVHPEDRNKFADQFSKCQQGFAGLDEGRILSKSGTSLWIRASGKPILSNGVFRGIRGVLSFIDEKKRAEDALRVSEERFRSITNNLPGVVYQFFARKNGQMGLHYVSDRCREIYGIDSTPLDDFFERFAANIHSDDRERFLTSIKDGRRNKLGWDWDGRYIHPDGHEMWIRGMSQPVRAGNELIFNGLMLDITDRKLTQLKLQDSEEKFRGLVQNLQDVVLILDSKGVVIFENPATKETLGYSLMGKKGFDIVHPDDLKIAAGAFSDVIKKSNKHRPTMFRVRHADGSWLYIDALASNMFENKIISGMLLVCRDVTQRNKAQMALRESEARFKIITTNLPGVVYQFYTRDNGEMGLYYVDDRCRDFFGIDNTPLADFLKRFTENIHADDQESFLTTIKNGVQDEIGWDWDGRYVHPDGHEMWIRGISQPIRVGNDLIYNGLMLDITDRKRAELKLQDSEEKFRGLVQNLRDVILIMDSNGVVIFENPATKEILGYSLMGKRGFDIVHPDDLNKATDAFSQVIKKTNLNRPFMFRVQHADGSWLYADALASNMFDNKIISGMLLVCRNVTQRIKAQTALRESEERYRALFEQSPLGVLHFDKNLIATNCNDRLAKFLNSTREKIIGIDLHRLRESVVIEKMEETIAGNFVSYEGPYRAITADSVISISVNTSPLRDEKGEVIGGMGVIEDITARKTAEEQLKLSEERNRLLVENANEGIAVIQDWKFVFTNPRFIGLTGYNEKELSARRFTEFVHPDDREMIAARYVRRLEGDASPLTYELRFIDKDGAIKWTEVNSVTLLWEQRPSALLFIRDISERKRAEEDRIKLDAQLQQAQKLESLGVLAGGIAHDFNNLLMAILGNIDLSLMDLTPSSPARGALLEAAKVSHRAADLCRQMLAYSGRGRFTSEALSLNDIIKDMAHMLEVSVSKKALLRYDLDSNIPPIEADATQIRQIIMNLVINSSDAIGQTSGVISLSTGVLFCDQAYLSEIWLNENLFEGTYAYIEVTDTGCGMEPENVSKIFDPFFTTKFTGRGLGLAAVLGIVRGHRGAIKVHSEKGKGTTFRILFPALERVAERVIGAQEVGENWRGSGTILFVDDEEMIRVVGKRMLEYLGFTVLTAKNGREAIDIFKENSGMIRCVIMDLTMPHMDGEEAFLELRRIRNDLCVIMSSGYSEQEISLRLVGRGVAGFIHKPYQVTELAAKLKKVLF